MRLVAVALAVAVAACSGEDAPPARGEPIGPLPFADVPTCDRLVQVAGEVRMQSDRIGWIDRWQVLGCGPLPPELAGLGDDLDHP